MLSIGTTAASTLPEGEKRLPALLPLTPSRRRWPNRLRPWLATGLDCCTWLYLLAVCGLWLVLRLEGDRWWLATIVLFGPRWVCALPLALLAPAVLWLRRSLWRPCLAAALLVFGPLMGLCLPWARLAAASPASIRLLTCNVKGHYADNAALEELIREVSPDVVALQGCWGKVRLQWPPGWQVYQEGELLVASGYPLRNISPAAGDDAPALSPALRLTACLVAAPQRSFCLCTLHLQSPRSGISQTVDRRTVLRPSGGAALTAQIGKRRLESVVAAQRVQELQQQYPSLLVAGDFNMPTESAIYRATWAAYTNAFSDAGWGFGYTEWPGMRQLPFGIRIDHVLSGPGWRPARCWVGPNVGSDHLPLIAELVPVGPPSPP